MRPAVRTSSLVETASVYSKDGFVMEMTTAAMGQMKSSVRLLRASLRRTFHVPRDTAYRRDGAATATSTAQMGVMKWYVKFYFEKYSTYRYKADTKRRRST